MNNTTRPVSSRAFMEQPNTSRLMEIDIEDRFKAMPPPRAQQPRPTIVFRNPEERDKSKLYVLDKNPIANPYATQSLQSISLLLRGPQSQQPL
jgi:hypothetical protein